MEIALGLVIGLAVGIVVHLVLRVRSTTDNSSLMAEKSRLEGELTQVTMLREQIAGKDQELNDQRSKLTALETSKAEFEGEPPPPSAPSRRC